MNEWQQMVKDFNAAGDVPMNARPDDIWRSEMYLALSLIDEEIKELHTACEFILNSHERLAEVADAIGDSIYVLLGLACRLGIDMAPVFAEIQRSNMSKVIEGNIVRNEAGKIIKPPHFSPPDLITIIREQMYKPV